MKKGRVKITHEYLKDVLNFPSDWEIEDIVPSFSDGIKIKGESELLISGDAFPETNNRGDAEDVGLIFHKEAIRVEVKKI